MRLGELNSSTGNEAATTNPSTESPPDHPNSGSAATTTRQYRNITKNRACRTCSRRYYPTGITITDSCSRFLSWEGTQLSSRSTGSALLRIRLSNPVVQWNQASRENSLSTGRLRRMHHDQATRDHVARRLAEGRPWARSPASSNATPTGKSSNTSHGMKELHRSGSGPIEPARRYERLVTPLCQYPCPALMNQVSCRYD